VSRRSIVARQITPPESLGAGLCKQCLHNNNNIQTKPAQPTNNLHVESDCDAMIVSDRYILVGWAGFVDRLIAQGY
jgi:hypothetical protein